MPIAPWWGSIRTMTAQPTQQPTSPGPQTDAALLQLLLDSTGEGVFGIDTDGCCTFVNRAGALMLGASTDKVLGRNMHGLIHHSHPDGRHYPECDCPIFNAFRQGLPCRIDHEVLWRLDGSPFDAEYSSYPVIEHGRVRGAVVTFVDITERKRAQALSDALVRQRELSHHREAVREAERTRIAREIHDELGSLLVALKMDLQWLQKRLEDRPPLQAKCRSMGLMIDTAVDNLGRIITDLRPSILDHQGLWAALEWQAQEFISTAELPTDLQVHVAPGVPSPDGPMAIAIFRIFQEMLSNVARHARASRLVIRVAVDDPPDPVLYLDVRDDGVGAAPGALADARSYGVLGMKERAGHFGGRLTIDSAPGQGTRVRLVMPLAGLPLVSLVPPA